MKSKAKISFTIILGFFLLSLTSCMVSRTGNFIPTPTALNSANFKYVRAVSGEAVSSSFGENVSDLMARAKKDLYQNAPLKDNQAYANVAIDITSSKVLLIFGDNKVKISADIIEFTK